MRKKHFYTLLDRNNNQVNIDLANYKCICTVTGARKRFYHKYLAGLIERDYDNNIDTFRTTYVSRAGKPTRTQADRLNDQIERARARLNELICKRDRIESEANLA